MSSEIVNVEFKAWPKIKRLTKVFSVYVTEKIDGTNACVIVQDGEVVGAQSRNKLITPESDNMGFAGWVDRNKEELATLGDGYHYGEWAGPGIQSNPHELEKKTFFLFNHYRWKDWKPECCSVVPFIYEGEYDKGMINTLMADLEVTRPGFEGVMVYFPFADTYLKHTVKSPEGKWIA